MREILRIPEGAEENGLDVFRGKIKKLLLTELAEKNDRHFNEGKTMNLVLIELETQMVFPIFMLKRSNFSPLRRKKSRRLRLPEPP